jgi:membrane protein implicated in regulation of membrane protease activity
VQQGRIPNIVNTFLVQPLPWLCMPLLHSINLQSIVTFSILGCVLLLVCVHFRDFRDHQINNKTTLKKLFKPNLILLGLAFFILNGQWEILFYISSNIKNINELNISFFLFEGVAFFTGVLITRLIKFDPKKMIKALFSLVFATILLNYLMEVLFNQKTNITPELYLEFTLLGGLGLPLFYAFYGTQVAVHEQGITYGCLESIQSLSELLAPVALLALAGTRYSYVILAPISLISTAMAWIALRKRTNATASK